MPTKEIWLSIACSCSGVMPDLGRELVVGRACGAARLELA